jgi:hypothetical protein
MMPREVSSSRLKVSSYALNFDYLEFTTDKKFI